MQTTPPNEIQVRFDQLQNKLVSMWKNIGRTDLGGPLEEANTIVVLPSLTIDEKIEMAYQKAYEERFLFMLLLLRQPNLRVIYITSLPVDPEIIDYYLGILPSVTICNARKRLFLISTEDASARPLVKKILDRPRLIEKIRSLIPDLDRAHLVPFVTTDLERQAALSLDIPMYAADPRFFAFGTKSGCRRLFAEENVPHPLGYEDLYTEEDLANAIAEMRRQKPAIRKVIVKLNQGVSGWGNASLQVADLPAPDEDPGLTSLREKMKTLKFEASGLNYTDYMKRLSDQGGIVEELLIADEIRSPSAQMRNTPTGEVEQLSTHDQILGGPSGQVYLGASFPAHVEYGTLIMREAKKIGDRLAREGIMGRYALDFIVVRDQDGDWQPYAIEVNLRKGGTTHPFLTLQYLTGGLYDPETGVFRTALGHQKYYVASDHVESPYPLDESLGYRLLTVADLLDLVSQHRLHYDDTSQRGIILHMHSAITTYGFFGMTAIGDTPEDAKNLFNQFTDVLDRHVVKLMS